MAKTATQLQAESDERRGQVLIAVKIDNETRDRFEALVDRYPSKSPVSAAISQSV